jgi:hypothetical protein
MQFQKLRNYWNRRWVRIILAVFLFASTAVIQYTLANIPRPLEFKTIDSLVPTKVKLGTEQLVIQEPVVTAGGLLLAYEGNPNETVDIFFDRAKLSGESLPLFKDAPSGFGTLVYSSGDKDTTAVRSESERCRSFVKVGVDVQRPPGQIHFFQSDREGLDRSRHIGMKSTNAELTVSLHSPPPPHTSKPGIGCKKVLNIDDWRREIAGSIGIKVVVAQNSSIRFHFYPGTPNPSYWQDGFFRPFVLGLPGLPSGQPVLQAKGLEVRSIGSSTDSTTSILGIQRAEEQPMLTVDALELGSSEIKVLFSGKGWVKVNGRLQTVNFLEKVQKNPIVAGVFALANTALLTWLVVISFGKRKADPGRRPQFE